MIVSGLSGNELYCLAKKGFAPGTILVGNSVYSLGAVRGFTSGMRTLAGGEIQSLSELISDGRHAAIRRLEEEAQTAKASGATGVSSQLTRLGGMHEFLAVGSSVHAAEPNTPFFTSACSGQDLYCQIDAGYAPRHFVIGNVAFAMGLGRGLSGALRAMAGGEVKEYSDMYNHTRHLALQRLEAEAASRGANAVVDVTTRIMSFGAGVKEMLMVGTASHNPALGELPLPATSELTGEELWNLTQMGYAPVRLLLGSSVYSLGFSGGLKAFFSSLSRGEVTSMSRLVYEARENCLAHIHREAAELKIDAVIGVKVFINELSGGLVEVLAIGTGMKKHNAVATHSEFLLPQAIIRDRDTFFDETTGPVAQVSRAESGIGT
jgi:uncharacterized protein YbjQ (UPF0145 family)